VALGKVAGVTSQGDRIVVKSFDLAYFPASVKALSEAKLNTYALNARRMIVSVPPVPRQQGAESASHFEKLGEEVKVAIRTIRQDARKQIACRGRGSEQAVLEATNAVVEEIERLVRPKVIEIGV
jgi:ribosome recycling factor